MIGLILKAMDLAVDLEDQLGGRAVEIGNERSDRILATKADSSR